MQHPMKLRPRLVLGLFALLVPLVMSTASAADTEPCATYRATPLATLQTQFATVIVAPAGEVKDEQFIGTEGSDLILAGAGDDVLKGGGGNDVLCGEAGHDGLNGVEGDDQLSGGSGNDLLTGAGGTDTMWGGTGRDAVYGGQGLDTIRGDGGGTDDATYDYLAGGADALTDVIVAGAGDEQHQERQSDVGCPDQVDGYARRIGAYGAWRMELPRLDPVASGCRIVRGVVEAVTETNDNDGDLHFKVRENSTGRLWTVEYMPRDLGHLPVLSVNNDVEIRGVHVLDRGHNHEEIHPVFRVTRINAGTTFYSGPWRGGSPEKLSPAVPTCNGCTPTTTTKHRFCWDEDGQPCKPWSSVTDPPGDGDPFRIANIAAAKRANYNVETYE